MKRATALFTAIFISLMSIFVSAEIITSSIAKETADSFLSLDNEWHHNTEASVRLVEQNGTPAYYIVEYNAGGWAIVSAQSSSSPVIGYNTTGEFAAPAPVSELLDFNAKLITARAKDLGNMEHIGWQRVKQRKASIDINNTPDIAPLITINLGQSAPYNKYCPTINGENTLVGCVAVGMTQAMMVQGHPSKAVGSYSYTSEETGTHSINYDAEPAYDWNAINNCEQTGNYDEVARLLYHAGVSVDMNYGVDGSGTQTELVAEALTRNFGYDKKTVYYASRHPNSNKWLEIILDELSHGRVVVYSGVAVEGGHCWNIDGWKQSTQMIHCNWGWEGYGNGYFSLDNMTDSYQEISFMYDHGAVFGVVAPTAAPYDIVLHSTQYALGATAGTTLSYVEVLSSNNNATYSYELFGPNGIQSPYKITNNKLTATESVADSDKFKYVRIKATNTTTGESYEKEFNIQIVSANAHKLIGSYDAFANSAFSGYPDEEWEITIVADKNDANKLWIQPICIFGGLRPDGVTAIYATYDEASGKLTMPIGQAVYTTPGYQMITGVSYDYSTIETSGNITLQATIDDKGVVISFPADIVFGVGNATNNEWWYQALHNISFTKKDITTAPYGIELSSTTFAAGTPPHTPLADIAVLCDDKSATFNYEVYDRQGNTSPYMVVNNTLMSSETIADNDTFKYMRIKATNALTGEAYEQAFDIQIVENKAAMFVGEYTAFANSAFQGEPDEEWVVNITADANIPNKVWIQPVCLFGGLDASYISPIYATYDVTRGVLIMPLGQVLYQQSGTYQMITGSTIDGVNINTTDNIELQVTQSDADIKISFASDYIFGVGNAIGNEWWYQALFNIAFTRRFNIAAPYGIELSTTSFAIGTSPNTPLTNVVVLCDDKSATFNYEVYDRQGNTSPYMVVNNILVSSETITDSDSFKYMRIKVTNALTGDAYEQEFNIQVVENKAAMFVGKYTAYAQSAFQDYPDEEWEVNITADNSVPNKVWIQPICLFGGLEASDINPVYATYDVTKGTFTMPLGQTLFQQEGTYQMIIGATVDGSNIDTTGSIEMQVSQSNEGITISFASDCVIGVGNAIGDEWWYQALMNVTFTRSINVENKVAMFVGEYKAFANSAFQGEPDEEWIVNITADNSVPNKIWIQPICLFGGLKASDINPVYATYDVAKGTLTMPLGQTLFQQEDTYQMIIGTSVDGSNINTTGSIEMQVTQSDEGITISFASDCVIGVGNAIDNTWWYQALMNVTLTRSINVENKVAMFVGEYNAFANSAFQGYPDEEWIVNITADNSVPNKIWIQPLCLFGGLEASDINPVYATYDVAKGTLTMPLGQTLFQQEGTYQMIIGTSVDGSNIDTTGSIEMQVTQSNEGITISFASDCVIGVGNAIGNEWWYQALMNVTFTQKTSAQIEVDGIYYNITSEADKSVEVTFRGSSYDEYLDEYTGSVVIPSTVVIDGTTYNVTAIGYRAFAKCTGLTNVTLPESISVIGEQSFALCSALTQVAHANSFNLIKMGAFQGCTELTDFTFPSHTITIERQAFYGSGLKGVTLTENMILDQAVFYECNNLTSIIIADGVTAIPTWTFGWSSTFTEVNFPSSVTTIHDFAFYNCDGLKEVYIPASITYIGMEVFNSCSALESIYVAVDNPVYDSRENCNALVETATNTLLTGCKNTVMPASITTIGSSAFFDVVGLTEFTIGSGVTYIGNSAFAACSNLTSIVIPESVIEIDDVAFAYCSALQRIEVNAINPPVIYEATFEEVDKTIEVLVPRNSVDAYKAADYWKEFTNFKENNGIDNTTDGNVNIHINNGMLVITGVDEDTVVSIYSISGVLIYNTTVEHVNELTLPHGVYLVVINNKTYKIAL